MFLRRIQCGIQTSTQAPTKTVVFFFSLLFFRAQTGDRQVPLPFPHAETRRDLFDTPNRRRLLDSSPLRSPPPATSLPASPNRRLPDSRRSRRLHPARESPPASGRPAPLHGELLCTILFYSGISGTSRGAGISVPRGPRFQY